MPYSPKADNRSCMKTVTRILMLICVQVPAAVVTFKWDQTVMKDILAAQGQVDENVFLKPELLQRVQELSQNTMIIELC